MALAGWLKQSTAVTVKIGPFVDSTNGNDEETALTIAQANVRLAKNSGDIAQKNDATTCTHDELGLYDCPLNATDTNTLGILTLSAHPAGALIVRHDFAVVPANVWDSLFGADRLQVDVAEMQNAVIAAATLAADTQTYQGKVLLFDDDGGTTDRYVVIWFNNGQPITSGITSPTIQVIKAADGTDLVASTALTQIGALGLYKYDEGTNRIVDGAAYIAKVQATIDGSTRTWYQPVGRDS